MSATELYRVHRPTLFKQMVGQETAIATIKGFFEKSMVPHVILLSGPSGCGKTTIARIMQTKLQCGAGDFQEVNCADFRGIDMVRDIRNRMGLSPIGGKCRIWLIDEAHQMSSQAQNAFLKMLEDTPGHVYFFLATTDPQKLLPTIRTRCTEIAVKSLSRAALCLMMKAVLEKAGATGNLKDWTEVLDTICDYAEGSARKALVLLNSALGLKTAEEMVDAVKSTLASPKAIALAQALLSPDVSWKPVAAMVKDLEEDPETLRWMILGYMTNVLLGGGKLAPRAFDVINIFERNFYDSKRAGLASACYAVVHRK
jgi:DNA polymerase-3 subunit gamma/tau